MQYYSIIQLLTRMHKLITQKDINTKLDNYYKGAFYDRIDQNMKELGYSSLYANNGNTMIISYLSGALYIKNLKALFGFFVELFVCIFIFLCNFMHELQNYISHLSKLLCKNPN